jgi:hypothetical protein
VHSGDWPSVKADLPGRDPIPPLQFGTLAPRQRLRRPVLLNQPLAAMVASMTSDSPLISTFAKQDFRTGLSPAPH